MPVAFWPRPPHTPAASDWWPGRLLTNLALCDLSGVMATIAGAIAVDAAVVYADSPGQEQTTAVAR